MRRRRNRLAEVRRAASGAGRPLHVSLRLSSIAALLAGLTFVPACGDGGDLSASRGSSGPGDFDDTLQPSRVELLLSTPETEHGGPAQACVDLITGGEPIAGVEADLVWDDGCSTLLECEAAPGLDKSLFTSRPDPATHRSFVLSLGDVATIPDGPLYCCSFEVDGGGVPCCPLALTAALASDPAGRPVAVPDVAGRICRE